MTMMKKIGENKKWPINGEIQQSNKLDTKNCVLFPSQETIVDDGLRQSVVDSFPPFQDSHGHASFETSWFQLEQKKYDKETSWNIMTTSNFMTSKNVNVFHNFQDVVHI